MLINTPFPNRRLQSTIATNPRHLTQIEGDLLSIAVDKPNISFAIHKDFTEQCLIARGQRRSDTLPAAVHYIRIREAIRGSGRVRINIQREKGSDQQTTVCSEHVSLPAMRIDLTISSSDSARLPFNFSPP